MAAPVFQPEPVVSQPQAGLAPNFNHSENLDKEMEQNKKTKEKKTSDDSCCYSDDNDVLCFGCLLCCLTSNDHGHDGGTGDDCCDCSCFGGCDCDCDGCECDID